MRNIQEIIDRKAEMQANEDLSLLLIKCLDIVCGTRTGVSIDLVIGSHSIKVNSSDAFRSLFSSITSHVENKYKEKASKEFVEKIKQLEGEFNDLLN